MNRIQKMMRPTWPAVIGLGLVVAWMSWWSVGLASYPAGLASDHSCWDRFPEFSQDGFSPRWQVWPPRLVCRFKLDSGSFEVRKAVPQDNDYLKNYALAVGLSALYVVGVGVKTTRALRRRHQREGHESREDGEDRSDPGPPPGPRNNL